MSFVRMPNLPEKLAGLVVVDCRLCEEAERRLRSSGVDVLRLRPHKDLYPAVSSHPDMVLHHLEGHRLIYAPGTDPLLLEALAVRSFELIRGESVLAPSYPADIAYNVARVGKWYFHNLKHTDPVLKKMLDQLGVEPVHVEQGYAKCSILPVDRESIVTMDAGIAKAAEKKGLEVLLMDRERSILLPGLRYGFIGGAAGMLGKSLCALNGSLCGLDCREQFPFFLASKAISILELAGGAVADVGSVLPLTEQ